MGAAIEFASGLYAMPNDQAVAVAAVGRQHTDGTFKTVKLITVAGHFYPEGLVVFIAAFGASGHN